MSKTTYPGIDYSGIGSSVNRDPDTRIRYGILSQNAVPSESLEDIFQNWTDLDYENFLGEVKKNLRHALSDCFSDSKWGEQKTSKLDNAVENAFDAISDELGDGYQGGGDCQRTTLEKDGYNLMTDSGGDLWVMKSPFFTYAQYCSPVAPGACHLGNPLDHIPEDGSNACYCLGHEWFEGGVAPYPVFNMGGAEILPGRIIDDGTHRK